MMRHLPVSILDNLAGRILRGIVIVILAAAFLALFALPFVHADSKETNYNGHYELAAVKTDRSFSSTSNKRPGTTTPRFRFPPR